MSGAQARLLAVLGDPIAHSLSPALHNYLIKQLKLELHYLAFRVAPGELTAAVAGLCALGAAGFNVTVPHKQAVAPLLDALTPEARALGAVNTVVNAGGRLVGHNTDWLGFLAPLEGHNFAGTRAVVLGAGGAAPAVLYGLARLGVGHVVLANRTPEKARALARRAQLLGLKAVEAIALKGPQLRQAVAGAALLINATSVGLHPNKANSPLEAATLHPGLTVYDLVYRPLETRLLREAHAAGARAVDGLGMLVGQGVAAFELWTGIKVDVTLRARVQAHLRVLLAD